MNIGAVEGAALVIAGAVLIGGCGTLGPPIPPEYVGVGPLLEKERLKEQQAEQAKAEDRTFSAEEAKQDSEATVEGVVLPSLQPVGTR